MRQRYVKEIERIFQEKLNEVVARLQRTPVDVAIPATPTADSAGCSTGGATSVGADATTTRSGSPTPGPNTTAPVGSLTSAPRASAAPPATIASALSMDASPPAWVTKIAEGRSETEEQTLQWIQTFVEESYGPMDNWLKFYEEQFVSEDLKRG